MTSGQESSDRARPASLPDIESLAGVFHPHAIEVQDFSTYGLVLDVRSRAEYEDDHIPGAVQIAPAILMGPLMTGPGSAQVLTARDSAADEDLPPALAALVSSLKFDQAILVYCGRGGQDSLPVARALRWRGWTVDVLPGGWINYRRWVQAGLEVLPRLVAFRVLSTSLGSEAGRVLRALSAVGHQVLDVEALAGWRHGSLRSPAAQPSQAWFESQLLQALRNFDPRLPVWVGAVDRRAGSLALPGSLADALAIAPTAGLEAPLPERLRRWREDEPLWQACPTDILNAVAATAPSPERALVARWRALARASLVDMMASVLRDHLDALWSERVAQQLARPNALSPLVTDSLEPGTLAVNVRAWRPVPEPAAD